MLLLFEERPREGRMSGRMSRGEVEVEGESGEGFLLNMPPRIEREEGKQCSKTE